MAEIPHFRAVVICSCQIFAIGNIRIEKSETILITAAAIRMANSFEQVPGTKGSHIFLRGRHSIMPTNMHAR